MIYLTADTHFGHQNIIKYCNRPFVSSSEMDSQIVDRWNSKITNNDVVYHLGDVAFGDEYFVDKIINRLNFSFLHVIKGNHDRSFSEWYKRNKPSRVFLYNSYLETKLDGLNFTLCHYAMRVWNKSHHGAYHCYGHSHGSLPDDPHAKSMDVGVDTNNYFPYSLDEVVANLSKKIFVPVDHHETR